MTGWNLGGEGGNSFAFDNVGDYLVGTVLDLAEVQQTDMDSGQPAFWDGGQPKMMHRVTLGTDLRDPADPSDDGKRSAYLKGSKKPESMSSLSAVLAAVKKATGGAEIKYGGLLTVQYVGDGQPSKRGFNAPKQYQAWYEAPAMQLEQPPEHRAASPQPAAPAFGSPADQPGQPPAWATGGAGAPTPPPPAPAGPPAPPQGPPATQAPPGPPPGQQDQQDQWRAANPAIPASPPVAPPAQQAAPPAAPPAAAPPGQPTPEQVAALQAVGVDPRTVYPGWQPTS